MNQKTEEIIINNEMKNLFKKNLKTLKDFLPGLYKYVKDYQPSNINLTRDNENYLNLRYAHEGNYIYPDNPKKNSHLQVDIYFNDPHRLISLSDKTHTQRASLFLHEYHIARFQKMMEEESKTLDSSYQTDHDYIPCMVIIGFGLGYHVEKIVSEHNIANLFIFEPNSDLFYGSLYTIDFYPFLKKSSDEGRSLTLQIGKDKNTFINNVGEKLYRRGLFPASKIYFYLHYNSVEANETFEMIRQVIHRIFQGWGFFEDELISIAHTIHNMKSNGKLLKNTSAKKNKLDFPAIIIGNGPSLDEEIEFIKKNQGHFVIFSSGSSLKPLYKAGIIPDFHVEIERTKAVYDWIMDINDIEYTKKITFLGLNTLYPNTAPLFKDFIWGLKSGDAGQTLIDRVYGENTFTHFGQCTATVVNGALEMAIFSGFKKIFFFGVDMGFKDPNYHHSKNSSYLEKNNKFFQKEIRQGLKLPGNFSPEIHTNNDMDHSRFCLEEQIKEHDDVHYFNCSDGVKISGALPLKSKDIQLEKIDSKEKTDCLNKIISTQVTDLNIRNNNKLDFYFNEMISDIEGFINLLQESLLQYPKNREELGLYFLQQFSWIHDLRQRDPLLSVMLSGTVNYLQGIIYADMINFRNEKEFEKAIKLSFAIFNDYLSDMLELIQTQPLTLHGDYSLESYFKKYKLNSH